MRWSGWRDGNWVRAHDSSDSGQKGILDGKKITNEKRTNPRKITAIRWLME